jgi:hypothetical protein
VATLEKDLKLCDQQKKQLKDRNTSLKDELGTSQNHGKVLSDQNLQLQQELEHFVETDKIVQQTIIDKMDSFKKARSEVDEKR